jgi:hypothetical protein
LRKNAGSGNQCRIRKTVDDKLFVHFRATAEFIDLKGKVFTFPLRGPIPFDDASLKSRVAMLVNLIDYMQAHLQDSGELLQVLYRWWQCCGSALP